MAYLVVLDGVDTGKIYELTGKKTIGSSQDNDIVLNDRRVYSHHLTVQSDSHHTTISTLAIHKPIEINGSKATKSNLQPGDVISIGSAILLFVKDEPKGWKKDNALSSYPLQKKHIEETKILSYVQAEECQGNLLSNFPNRENLKMLMDINIAIQEIHSLPLLLQHILSILLKNIKADRGFIILMQENQKWEVASLYQKKTLANAMILLYIAKQSQKRF